MAPVHVLGRSRRRGRNLGEGDYLLCAELCAPTVEVLFAFILCVTACMSVDP